MARVNLDGKVWKDPRVKRLARKLGWSLRETVGTLAAIWDVAYDNKSNVMSIVDVDTAAETDGFAVRMVADELADAAADDHVRLRGIEERIQYLLAQAERGRAGGLAKARRSLGDGLADGKQPPGLPPDPSPALHLDHDPSPDPDQKKSAPVGAASLHPESLRLSRLLFDLIVKAQPASTIANASAEASKKRVEKWADDIEKLHRINLIAWPDIEAVITWARSDDFWAANILSGKKLREKYDTLHAQMQRGNAPRAANNNASGHAKPHAPNEYPEGELQL